MSEVPAVLGMCGNNSFVGNRAGVDPAKAEFPSSFAGAFNTKPTVLFDATRLRPKFIWLGREQD